MNFDLQQLIKTFGYGIWAIVFAESGLLFGFFLPSVSLLFAAGIVASGPNSMNIWTLIFGCFVCAVAGDNIGMQADTVGAVAYLTRKIRGCLRNNI